MLTNYPADQAMVVSDKFAALAAESATDYEELAIALSKVAAQAYSAGVNMDNMMGFIAKALEVTREAPENIGTAFKTIFARMSELKDFGKTLEDGMDINRIDKALASVGISLTTEEGTLRNLDEVLIDIGNQWTTLTKNQKAYVTAALAGTRQQTRLLAVFEDFDRTMELVDISANSLGATFAQQEKYYSSIAYAQNKLTVAWQDLISSVGSSVVFIMFYNILSTVVGLANDVVTVFKEFGSVLLFASVAALAFGATVAISNKELYKQTVATELANGASIKNAVATGIQAIAHAGLAKVLGAVSLGFKAVWKAMGPVGWAILGLTAIVTIFGAAMNSTKKKK